MRESDPISRWRLALPITILALLSIVGIFIFS